MRDGLPPASAPPSPAASGGASRTAAPPDTPALDVRVRPAGAADRDAWLRMRTALWPHGASDHPGEVDRFLAGDARAVFPGGEGAVLVAEAAGRPVGLLEVSLRSTADGCSSSPVGYLEGLWVDEDVRRAGVARRLVEAGEAWARERGCSEMASDALVENRASRAWHLSMGYLEVDVQVTFRKILP